jgi:hypothetical protein
MYIMQAYDFYTFPMAKKRKEERKEKSKQRLVYLKTLSHTSRQNLHYTYLHGKMLFLVYCMCHVFTFKISFLLCNSKLMGK